MTADRATVGLGLAIRRWTNRPPLRRGKPAHRTILAAAPRPLAALAIGVGVGAAALLAARELRRAGDPPVSEPVEDQPGAARKRGTRGRARRARRARDRDRARDRNRDRDRDRDRDRAVQDMRATSIAQMDRAITALEAVTGEADLEEAVHETRKAIKRVRTLERLTAGTGDRAQRRRRRDLLRGAAGELSGVRDAQVSLGTLEGLMRRAPKRLGADAGVARLRAKLLAERAAAERALRESGGRERALGLLRQTRASLADAAAGGGGARVRAGVLNDGVTRIYRRGRGAMRIARKHKGIAEGQGIAEDQGIAEMHEWRKRVKDLRYAAEALGDGFNASAPAARGERRERLRRIARDADRLGEALGEEHDLALLARRVSAEDAIFRGQKAGRKELQRAIRRRRRALRKQAFRAGGELYRAKPKRFRDGLPKRRS
jgi:CHAD domain-containing protein